MQRSNSLYLIIGALVVVVAIGGYFFYQERHKTGIDLQVGGKGISIQTQ